MKQKSINHRGYVYQIDSDQVDVMISVSSACASCHAKGACTSADNSERHIIIKDDKHSYQIGQEVNITGTQSMGMSAVFYAYVLPFLFVFIALLLMTEVTALNELRAGLYALLLLPPYYLALYGFRNKLETKYTFTIN